VHEKVGEKLAGKKGEYCTPPMNNTVSRRESGWSLRRRTLAGVCCQSSELLLLLPPPLPLLLLLLLLLSCNLNTPRVAQARNNR
jgi:hypothetical protein